MALHPAPSSSVAQPSTSPPRVIREASMSRALPLPNLPPALAACPRGRRPAAVPITASPAPHLRGAHAIVSRKLRHSAACPIDRFSAMPLSLHILWHSVACPIDRFSVAPKSPRILWHSVACLIVRHPWPALVPRCLTTHLAPADEPRDLRRAAGSRAKPPRPSPPRRARIPRPATPLAPANYPRDLRRAAAPPTTPVALACTFLRVTPCNSVPSPRLISPPRSRILQHFVACLAARSNRQLPPSAPTCGVPCPERAASESLRPRSGAAPQGI